MLLHMNRAQALGGGTLHQLLGLIRADGGTVTVLGHDPWRDAVRLHRLLAYVPGDVSLWPNLTGGEIIDLLVRWYPEGRYVLTLREPRSWLDSKINQMIT